MNQNCKTVTAVVVLLVTSLVFADPATMVKNDSMREKPFADSKVIIALKKGLIVDISKREGAWYYITSAKKSGWLPMASLRRSQSGTKATSGSLSTVSTGRTSSTGVVSTTGVRGLNEESLQSAAFSEEAVASAEKMRVSVADAQQFAVQGQLKPQNVPALKPVALGGKK